MQTTTRSRYAPNTRLSPAASQLLGTDNTESALTILDDRLKDLDPDKRIAAIAPSALPSPLPAANKGEYFYFNSEDTITVNSVDFLVNKGDWLWCNADDTAEGDETKWEVIGLPEGRSPFWVDPVKSKVDAPPNIGDTAEGDRYLLDSVPPIIKVVKGGAFIDEELVNFATVRDEAGVVYQRKGNQLFYEKEKVLPAQVNFAISRIPLVEIVPAGAAEGEQFLIDSTATVNPNTLAEVADTGIVYTPLMAGQTYLNTSDSAIAPDNRLVFDGSAIAKIEPATAAAVYLGKDDLLLEWEDKWTGKLLAKTVIAENKTFYLDTVNGNDSNDGETEATAFKDLQTALYKIAGMYDFPPAFTGSLRIIDTALTISSVLLPVMRSQESDLPFRILPHTSCAVSVTSGGSGFIQSLRQSHYDISGLTIIGLGAKSAFRINEGRFSYDNNIFTGQIASAFLAGGTSVSGCGANQIQDLTGAYYQVVQASAVLIISGVQLASGGNSFSRNTLFAQKSSKIFFSSNAVIYSLGGGATVSAKKFKIKDSADINDRNSRPSSIIWGDAPGEIFGSGGFNNLRNFPRYTSFISGNAIAIKTGDTTKLSTQNTSFAIYDASDRAEPFWKLIELEAQDLDAPGITSGYVFATEAGYQFGDTEPSESYLSDRLYLGDFRITGGVLDSFRSRLIENSPSSLDVLARGGTVNVNGLFPVPLGGAVNAKLAFPQGWVLDAGANFFADYTNPHRLDIAERSPLSWTLLDQDGGVLAVNQEDLDFTQYWNGTALINVPNNNDAVLLFLYFKAPDEFYLVRGREFYNTINVAEQRYTAEAVPTPPQVQSGSIFLSTLIGRKDATNSATQSQVIIVNNTFASGGGGAAQITDGVIFTTDIDNLNPGDFKIAIEQSSTLGIKSKVYASDGISVGQIGEF